MNNERRKKLKKVSSLLTEAGEIASFVREEEEMALGNIPESLERSDMCGVMEDNIDSLDDAIESIGGVITIINEIIQK